MNAKKSNFQINKKYFIALSIVMLLNLILGGFLIHNVLAQQTELVIKDQPPVKVEVESQKDSPLLITILNVDNSDDIFQIANYTIQNVSDKPI